jgi:hypothetical protein
MEIFVVRMMSSPKADVAGLTKRVRGKGESRRRGLGRPGKEFGNAGVLYDSGFISSTRLNAGKARQIYFYFLFYIRLKPG